MRTLPTALRTTCFALLALASSLFAQGDLTAVNQKLDQLHADGMASFNAAKYQEAATAFTQGFELCRSTLKQVPKDPLFTESAYHFLTLSSKAFEKMERFADALQLQEPGAQGYAELVRDTASPTQELIDRAASEQGNLAWIRLLNKDHEGALRSAEEGLRLNPKLTWIYTNLAHSLVLAGRVDEAKDIYLKYQDEVLTGGSFKAVSLEDVTLLRKHAGGENLYNTVYRIYQQTPPAQAGGGVPLSSIKGAPSPSPAGTPVKSSNPAVPAGKGGSTLTAKEVDRIMARSSGSWWLLLIVPLVFLFVGGMFFVIWRLSVKRAKALEARAKELGLTYRARPQAGDEQFLTGTRLHQVYRAARAIGNIMEYQDGPDRVAIFDYAFTTGTGNDRRTHRQTILLVASPRLALPAFVLRRETLGSKVSQWLGTSDINFAEHPGFSRHFQLQGTDEAAVRRTFQLPVLEFCMQSPELYMEGQGNRVMFFTRRTEVSAETLPALMARGKQLAQLLASPGTFASPGPAVPSTPSAGVSTAAPPPLPVTGPAPVAAPASSPPPIPGGLGTTPPPIPD